MSYPNIFQQAVTQQVVDRIEQLTPETQPQWGKMNVAQMLAHCCVTYEMAFTDKHPKPNAFMRMMLKAFVKQGVVGPKPYAKNSRTAPVFIVDDERDFEPEKKRLIDFMWQAQSPGEDAYVGRESLSFGKLSKEEWNVMFYKHLDHHLTQFGV